MREPELIRLAMWSGPRNISTAMMRAWENRPDCVVSDEPFYAAWLSATGEPHPMAQVVIDEGETDALKVAHSLSEGEPPAHFNDGRPVRIWYQKQMCQHWMEELGFDWLHALTHVFLIRDPAKVVLSYIKARETVDITPHDVGLPQQAALFEEITKQQGFPPPVIDSEAFLMNPKGYLAALCDELGLAHHGEAMVQWPSGPRDSDGIWASHWYQRVWGSTGFEPPQEEGLTTEDKTLSQNPKAKAVVAACQPYYRALKKHTLVVH